MDFKTFNISGGLTVEQYHAVLDFCATRSSKILFVVRDRAKLSRAGNAILQSLSTLGGAEATDCFEWPGTKLLSGTARVYKFPIDSRSMSVLKNCKNELF